MDVDSGVNSAWVAESKIRPSSPSHLIYQSDQVHQGTTSESRERKTDESQAVSKPTVQGNRGNLLGIDLTERGSRMGNEKQGAGNATRDWRWTMRKALSSETGGLNTFLHISTTVAVLVFLLESHEQMYSLMEPMVWFSIEAVCVAVFSIEAVVGIAAFRVTYFKDPMHWIDLAAIAPFFFNIAMTQKFGPDSTEDTSLNLNWLRVMRLSKVLRVVKMGSFSSGVIIFTQAIARSMAQLLALASFTLIALIIFSSCIYYCELHYNDQPGFASIPDSFWWTLVTLTMVGYGDAFPVTWQGKITGSMTMLVGVLIFAMPITVIGNNYDKANRAEEMRRLLRDLRNGSELHPNGVLSQLDLEDILRKGCKWSTAHHELMEQIDVLFGFYDNDNNGVLDKTEIACLIQDLVDHLYDSHFTPNLKKQQPGEASGDKETQRSHPAHHPSGSFGGVYGGGFGSARSTESIHTGKSILKLIGAERSPTEVLMSVESLLTSSLQKAEDTNKLNTKRYQLQAKRINKLELSVQHLQAAVEAVVKQDLGSATEPTQDPAPAPTSRWSRTMACE